MSARAGTLTDDDVEFEILHGGIENLFDIRLKPVDLIDKQHIAEFKVREDGGQIALQLDQRARGGAEMCGHFVRDDGSQCGLAQSWGAIQQYVIERLAAFAASLDGD